VQAFLFWNPVKLVYCLASLSCLFVFVSQISDWLTDWLTDWWWPATTVYESASWTLHDTCYAQYITEPAVRCKYVWENYKRQELGYFEVVAVVFRTVVGAFGWSRYGICERKQCLPFRLTIAAGSLLITSLIAISTLSVQWLRWLV